MLGHHSLILAIQSGYDSYQQNAPPPSYGSPPPGQLAPYNAGYDDHRASSGHGHGHHGSNAGYYNGPPQGEPRRSGEQNRGGNGKEGERGIGASLVGAAGGGFLGHEVGGGLLGTIGGALAGAIGANALEHRHEKYVLVCRRLCERH